MDILINVVNQRLRLITNVRDIVAGTENFVRFVFQLGGGWEGLTIVARFTQNGTVYEQTLDSNNAVYLPSQIVAGECSLMLTGTSSNKTAVTKSALLTIIDNDLG